ncbi:MAG TPA: hypothetical protein VKT51_05565 [Candidatus Eremiobacteraceae bacterium]|nr:hypothetical protein [Candidatus Eremiobacteraceae bacterium]
MKTAAVFLQWIVRLSFAGLVILGIAFWTGHAFNMVPLHMALGIALVVGLWITAILGFAARVPIGQPLLAIVWGFVVVGLGMAQTSLLPGSSHWVIQLLHLLVGMAAVGMNESLARAIKSKSEGT